MTGHRLPTTDYQTTLSPQSSVFSPNLVLAGFMGTGKTTIGLLLARRLNRPFVDTDKVIEEEIHLTVAEIFAGQGEAAFRRLEREACHKIATSGGQIVALGGGALLDPANRADLESTGVLVLLTCRPDVLVSRLGESARRRERPLLGADIREAVSRLLTAREPIYAAVQLQVDTTERTPEEVADEVRALYEQAIEPMMQGIGQ